VVPVATALPDLPDLEPAPKRPRVSHFVKNDSPTPRPHVVDLTSATFNNIHTVPNLIEKSTSLSETTTSASEKSITLYPSQDYRIICEITDSCHTTTSETVDAYTTAPIANEWIENWIGELWN
jgi:hypothetical protein